jgi:hypothetical protein
MINETNRLEAHLSASACSEQRSQQILLLHRAGIITEEGAHAAADLTHRQFRAFVATLAELRKDTPAAKGDDDDQMSDEECRRVSHLLGTTAAELRKSLAQANTVTASGDVDEASLRRNGLLPPAVAPKLLDGSRPLDGMQRGATLRIESDVERCSRAVEELRRLERGER